MVNEKISVLIPVYNAQDTLTKCLNSLCGQTYENLEILLINDGSVDSSLEICQSFAQRDARIAVYTQENAGPSAARNKALALATGDYVTFVDSDDYVESDMIEKMMEAARQHTADMVICNFVEENEAGVRYHKFRHRSGYYNEAECRELALDLVDNNSKTRIPPYSCIRLVRREIFTQTGLRYNPRIRRSEDYLLWTQMHFKIKSLYVLGDAHLYHYVTHLGSITRSHLPGYWDMCKLLYGELKENLPADPQIHKRLQAMLLQRSLIALHSAARADRKQFAKETNEILRDKELLNAARSVGLVKNSKRARVYALMVMLRQKWLIKIYVKKTEDNRAV